MAGAAGAPSIPARRPDRLAVYMGCCAHRYEQRVIAHDLAAAEAKRVVLHAESRALVDTAKSSRDSEQLNGRLDAARVRR
ncbi:MAG: hypothetical protein ACXVFQ_25960 [Solirubrobacteraceae bacterium]